MTAAANNGIMAIGRKRPQVSPQQALGAKPLKLVDETLTRNDDGSAKVTVPLRPGAFGRLFRLPAGSTKTFELDALGLFVWDRIDGRTSVKRIVRELAKEWKLDPRAAEVSTLTFLRTLIKRGLVGATPPEAP